MSRHIALMFGISALLLSGTAQAAPIQALLDEDFQDVTGINTAGTERTVQDILTSTPGQLDGSPVVSFANTGNGNASAASFNVRRWSNAIDGASGSPTLGNGNFDNFFGGSPNQFLVIGDDNDGLGDVANGGSNAIASSTMSMRFALDAVTLGDPEWLAISFDYVFDANDVANPDDFVAELLLADNSVVGLLDFAAPTAGTRGSFSVLIDYATLAAAPSSLRFRLVEGTLNGSSAVGLDDLSVTAVPEPAVVTLLGLGLLGLGMMRRRRRI